MTPRPSAASRFALLYAAQFFAVGVMLPFLPPVLAGAGLSPAEIAAVLAAGAAVRLVAGPLGGRAADAIGDPRVVLLAGAATAAVTACGFGLAAGFAALLAVNMVHSAAMAQLVPLTDALALGAAARGVRRVRLRAGAGGGVGQLHPGGLGGGRGGGAPRPHGGGVVVRRRAGGGRAVRRAAAGARGRERGAPVGRGRGRGRLPRTAAPAGVPAAAGAVGADPGQPCALLRLRLDPLGRGGAFRGGDRAALGRGRGGGGGAVLLGAAPDRPAGPGRAVAARRRGGRAALGGDGGDHGAARARRGAVAARGDLRRAAPGGDARAGAGGAAADGGDGADAAREPGRRAGERGADAGERATLRGVGRGGVLGDGGLCAAALPVAWRLRRALAGA